MSKITKTKLGRAKWRIGRKIVNGKIMRVARIAGFNPPKEKYWVTNKEGDKKVYVSEGEFINWNRR